MVAASVLPVSICKGELLFLFGKENEMEDSAKGFSDFGGSVESGESIVDTAMREGSEELCGFLGNSNQISQLIKKNGGIFTLVYGSENKAYHVHIFFMEYDERLPEYFTNHHRFLWERMDKKLLNDSKFFEKQEIRWFSERDMKKKKSEFRPFYREIVNMFLDNISNIKTFIKNREKRVKKSISRSSKSKTMKIRGG